VRARVLNMLRSLPTQVFLICRWLKPCS
jgi:hypothetical protein